MYTLTLLVFVSHFIFQVSEVLGDCSPLLIKRDQFLRVICYGSVECDKPGIKIPTGARAILKCLDNYEPESTTQQQVILTCQADSKWMGLVDVEQLWCKANGTPIDIHQFKIGVGIVPNPSTSLGTTNAKQTLNIQAVLVDEKGIDGGIALLLADGQIKLSEYVQPICMPDKDVFVTSSQISGEVVGLGSINVGSGRNWSSDTRIISVPLTSQTDCKSDIEIIQRDLPGPKYCARITEGRLECGGGGGYGFMTNESDPTRYTLQGVIGSASTEYTCTGFAIITPLFVSLAWIREKAALFERMVVDQNDIPESTTPISSTSDSNSNQTGNVITYVAVGAIILGILAVAYSCRSHFLREEEIDTFFKGVQLSPRPTLAANPEGAEYECLPYDTTYEIKDSEFNFDNSHILGSGTYGVVYKGSYMETPVAVKTVRNGAEKAYLMALLSELKVMIHLGKHPQLVSLIGAKTKHLQRGVLYILVELCSMGSLAGYLAKYHNVYGEGCKSSTLSEVYSNSGRSGYENLPMTRNQLLKWAFEISLAMEFLENKKVIHGDLAARNVLLTENLTVKVSDFGLSRKLYEYTTYVKKHQEPLPWRWMATESLQRLEFSTKSDVWSFGVTLWEIFTLGDVPYPGLSYTIDFTVKLCDGLRLYPPPLASEEIYEIMQNCWQQKPEERPGFQAIKIKLHSTMMAMGNSLTGEYTELN